MKYVSKFIAIGLGFALVFTATNFSQGWFKSECSKASCITISRYKDAFYHKRTGIGGKHDYIYIPIEYIDGRTSVNNVTATLTYGRNGEITFELKDKGEESIQIKTPNDYGIKNKNDGNYLGNCQTHKIDSEYYIRLNHKMNQYLDDHTNYKLSITVNHGGNKNDYYKYDMVINHDDKCKYNVSPVSIKPYTELNTSNEGLEVLEQELEMIEETSEPDAAVPNQTDIIAQKKEEVEETSEPDVVVSNQTDIIAQKKEEDAE